MNEQSAEVGSNRKQEYGKTLQQEWREVYISMLGPDATTEVGRIVFFCCPLCACMVAADEPEDGQPSLRDHHTAWHLGDVDA